MENYIRLNRGHRIPRLRINVKVRRPFRFEWLVLQNSWSVRIHRHQVSVSRRHRGSKWRYEHYDYDRPRTGYHFYNVSWSNPTKHKWWARSIHLYINL